MLEKNIKENKSKYIDNHYRKIYKQHAENIIQSEENFYKQYDQFIKRPEIITPDIVKHTVRTADQFTDRVGQADLLMEAIAHRSIKKIHSNLYEAQKDVVSKKNKNKKDRLYFYLERLTKENFDFWTTFTGRAGKNSDGAIVGYDGVMNLFKKNITQSKEIADFWIAYISHVPIKNSVKEDNKSNKIELIVTVSTKKKVPFSVHMGIMRTNSSLPQHGSLSPMIHAFAAQAMKVIYPDDPKHYMITAPTAPMRKLLSMKVINPSNPTFFWSQPASKRVNFSDQKRIFMYKKLIEKFKENFDESINIYEIFYHVENENLSVEDLDQSQKNIFSSLSYEEKDVIEKIVEFIKPEYNYFNDVGTKEVLTFIKIIPFLSKNNYKKLLSKLYDVLDLVDDKIDSSTYETIKKLKTSLYKNKKKENFNQLIKEYKNKTLNLLKVEFKRLKIEEEKEFIININKKFPPAQAISKIILRLQKKYLSKAIKNNSYDIKYKWIKKIISEDHIADNMQTTQELLNQFLKDLDDNGFISGNSEVKDFEIFEGNWEPILQKEFDRIKDLAIQERKKRNPQKEVFKYIENQITSLKREIKSKKSLNLKENNLYISELSPFDDRNSQAYKIIDPTDINHVIIFKKPAFYGGYATGATDPVGITWYTLLGTGAFFNIINK